MDFILWAAELWDLPTPLCTKDVPLTMSRESNKSMKYQWYDWSQQTIVINFKFAELVPNQGLLFKKGRDNKYDKKASNWCSAWCSKQSGGGPDTWWHSLRLGFYLLPRKCFYLHMLACDITQPRYQIRMACATPEKKKKKKKVQQKSPVGISLVHRESRWHLQSKISLN